MILCEPQDSLSSRYNCYPHLQRRQPGLNDNRNLLKVTQHRASSFNYKQSLCCVNCVLGTVAGAEGSDGLDKHGPYYPGACGAHNPRVAGGDRC